MYVHGAGGDSRLWTEQAPIGPGVAVDLTGHGGSDDAALSPGPETLDAYAADLCALADKTDARAVVGNSMGGAVALWAVLEDDLTPGRLVLCGTGAKLGVGEDLLALLERDFEAAIGSLAEPGLLFSDPECAPTDRALAALCETGSSVTWRDFATCDSFDVRDRLDAVDVPTLALTGEDDGMTPPAFTTYLGDALPDCETALLADCGHLSMLEQPRAFNERVATFLGCQ